MMRRVIVTDLQMWNLVLGFVSATFVLPIIQQPAWSVKTRAAVTFVYCVLTALVTTYIIGGFSGLIGVHALVTSTLVVLITAIASYKGFAQPTGIAPAIESATSPKSIASR